MVPNFDLCKICQSKVKNFINKNKKISFGCHCGWIEFVEENDIVQKTTSIKNVTDEQLKEIKKMKIQDGVFDFDFGKCHFLLEISLKI